MKNKQQNNRQIISNCWHTDTEDKRRHFITSNKRGKTSKRNKICAPKKELKNLICKLKKKKHSYKTRYPTVCTTKRKSALSNPTAIFQKERLVGEMSTSKAKWKILNWKTTGNRSRPKKWQNIWSESNESKKHRDSRDGNIYLWWFGIMNQLLDKQVFPKRKK